MVRIYLGGKGGIDNLMTTGIGPGGLPEPSTVAASALGLLMLKRRRRA